MILAIGDSLGVGSDPFLRERVAHVHTESYKGITAEQGLRLLRRHGHADALVFALGTNQIKVAGNLDYRRTLLKVRRSRPRACLILVSIHGVPGAHALNRAQRSIPGARIARWDRLVRRKPALLASDGVHATPRGYRLRARLIAGRLRTC